VSLLVEALVAVRHAALVSLLCFHSYAVVTLTMMVSIAVQDAGLLWWLSGQYLAALLLPLRL